MIAPILRRVVVASVLALLSAPVAKAHETTRSYVTVTRDGAAIITHLRIAFRDIEVVVWMDENLDGAITWAEATRRLDAVTAYVTSGLRAHAGGACILRRVNADASSDAGIAYLDLDFAGQCPDATTPLTLSSRLFAEIDPDHRMFLQITDNGTEIATLIRTKDGSSDQ